MELIMQAVFAFFLLSHITTSVSHIYVMVSHF